MAYLSSMLPELAVAGIVSASANALHTNRLLLHNVYSVTTGVIQQHMYLVMGK